jgi:hypothetical protein
MYKPFGTIREALNDIHKNNFVLPAIQREFVWQPEQIERFFDSLLQGYPFGTFLFWKVDKETSSNFKFYKFMLNYHQRDAAHCTDLGPIQQSVIAVLDGQQRLTALNIGLRGSMALKQPNKWWNNDDAFPRRSLHLDLTAPPVRDDDGAIYRFKFLEPDRAKQADDAHWFKVGDILTMEDGPSMLSNLQARGLKDEELNLAFRTLSRLFEVVNKGELISYHEEKSQDIERVLNIFIRLNAGGTVLSYSDLLLSIAVAQWKQIDARAAIHTLVDELNRTGTGFALTKDFVLKAGLMLADIASVGFKVENFTASNMEKLEANWPKIRTALRRTVELVASFGLNGQTLRADSALLPIAYYLYRRDFHDNYVTHSEHATDREAIRGWLIRSLLKASGIWGSGLDTLLTALRETIRTNGAGCFPVDAVRQLMTQRGKSLTFEAAEIDDLLHIEYGDKRLFALLSLLFSFVDLRNKFHIDHIYPISRFTQARLSKIGFGKEDAERLERHANELPNLQLLQGEFNNEKRAAMPAEWLAKHMADPVARSQYCSNHLLGNLPPDLHGFDSFYAARRDLLRARLTSLLAVALVV